MTSELWNSWEYEEKQLYLLLARDRTVRVIYNGGLSVVEGTVIDVYCGDVTLGRDFLMSDLNKQEKSLSLPVSDLTVVSGPSVLALFRR